MGCGWNAGPSRDQTAEDPKGNAGLWKLYYYRAGPEDHRKFRQVSTGVIHSRCVSRIEIARDHCLIVTHIPPCTGVQALDSATNRERHTLQYVVKVTLGRTCSYRARIVGFVFHSGGGSVPAGWASGANSTCEKFWRKRMRKNDTSL